MRRSCPLAEITVATERRSQMVDITERVQEQVGRSGVDEGICLVYVPHTTCGIAINEGADPDVQRDVLQHLDELVPHEGRWQHGEGNSDAHIKAILVGSDVTLPVSNGRARLGRWQSIFLCEFDGPRRRSVWISIR